MSYIAKNIERIRTEIDEAARKSGRTGKDVTIVAVTKYATDEQAREAIEAGIRELGENYAQELSRKRKIIDVHWNFIGQLQLNKVKYIVDGYTLIQSVDRAEALLEIQKRSSALEVCTDFLIQVNIAGETQKAGTSPSFAVELAKRAADLPNVRLRGLMAIMPIGNAETLRPYFRDMRILFESMKREFPGLDCLSMGMSQDYAVAVEEGATMVRLGSSIFKRRDI